MSVSNSTSSVASKVKPTTEDDKAEFFEGLKDVFPESAVLTAVEVCMPDITSSTCTSSQLVHKLPPPLTSLCNAKHLDMGAIELQKHCDTIFHSGIMSISEAEAGYLEQSTRLQSQSLLWHEQRVGRITASKFHAVSRTSTMSPSKSLVKDLLNVSKMNPMSVPALNWGITNESNARKSYLKYADEHHVKFMYCAAGLFVNIEYVHLNWCIPRWGDCL